MFLIGEFSKISRVSKRLLHYYDDIGLLKPAHIDGTTGYRYYSAAQLPRLNRILALKALGLSLDQIMQMVRAEISDDEIHGMLMIKRAEAEQAVLDDLQRLRSIEARLQQNRTAGDPLDVVIKSIPAQRFLSVRARFSSPEAMMQLFDQMLHVVPASVGRGVLGPFAGLFFAEDFSLTDTDVEVGYLLKKPVTEPIPLGEDYVLQMRELPAVETMATSVQAGVPDPELLAFGKIARWIEANGYRMAGPSRELGFDISELSDLATAVLEIQMPVEKAPPSGLGLGGLG